MADPVLTDDALRSLVAQLDAPRPASRGVPMALSAVQARALSCAADLAREVLALRAIVEGRTTPPTDAEIEAHADRDNGGAWLVRGEVAVLYFDDGELFVQVAEHTYGHNPRRPDEARMWLAARAAEGAVWVPLFDDRPCAWPTAEAPRG